MTKSEFKPGEIGLVTIRRDRIGKFVLMCLFGLIATCFFGYWGYQGYLEIREGPLPTMGWIQLGGCVFGIVVTWGMILADHGEAIYEFYKDPESFREHAIWIEKTHARAEEIQSLKREEGALKRELFRLKAKDRYLRALRIWLEFGRVCNKIQFMLKRFWRNAIFHWRWGYWLEDKPDEPQQAVRLIKWRDDDPEGEA